MLKFLLNKFICFKKIMEYLLFFSLSNIFLYILLDKNIYYSYYNELNVFILNLTVVSVSNLHCSFSKVVKYVYRSKHYIETVYILTIIIIYLFYTIPVISVYIFINICILNNSVYIDNLLLSYFLILLNTFLINFITKDINLTYIISLPLNLPIVIYYLYNNILYNIYILNIYMFIYPLILYYIFKKK